MKVDFLSMLTELSEIVRTVAQEEILPRFNSQTFDQQTKRDGSVVTEVDSAVQQRIATLLQERWPDTAFLGEEMTTAEQAELLTSGNDGRRTARNASKPCCLVPGSIGWNQQFCIGHSIFWRFIGFDRKSTTKAGFDL